MKSSLVGRLARRFALVVAMAATAVVLVLSGAGTSLATTSPAFLH